MNEHSYFIGHKRVIAKSMTYIAPSRLNDNLEAPI